MAVNLGPLDDEKPEVIKAYAEMVKALEMVPPEDRWRIVQEVARKLRIIGLG